jgi:uncharacterized RDD family membrane protein YckC
MRAIIQPVNGRLPGEGSPAGFWVRALAALVDFLLFFLVQFSLGFAAAALWGTLIEDSAAFQVGIAAFTLLFAALYTTVLHAAVGQTLGKLLLGVRVVAVDGERLSAGAALLRYLGYFLSLLPLPLGFAMAGLRRDKRALHDLLAGSRVERQALRRRWRPAPPPAAQGVTSPDPV